jgi:hypothetical protein
MKEPVLREQFSHRPAIMNEKRWGIYASLAPDRFTRPWEFPEATTTNVRDANNLLNLTL